jgi:hypothetical protein
LEVVEHLQENL